MVLFNDMLMLDVTGPMDVFSISNRLLPEDQHYRLLTVAEHQTLVRSSCGLKVQADMTLQDLPAGTDLLLVPGGPGAYGVGHPGLTAWLPKAVKGARRFGAICTGAFLLGDAGLLDGYRCTTHWNYVERLAQREGREPPRWELEIDEDAVPTGKRVGNRRLKRVLGVQLRHPVHLPPEA